MGRYTKKGIDYFPVDVDIFGDRKVRRLIRFTGGKGFTVFTYILAQVYREGYFIEWDKDSAFDVADDLGLPEDLVEEVVRVCCRVGLFHQCLFTDMGVLTSESIQRRWQKIVKDAKRIDTEIDDKYRINNGMLRYPPEEKPKTPEETGKTPEETPQRGVKGRKEEERGEEQTARAREGPDPPDAIPTPGIEQFDDPKLEELYQKYLDYRSKERHQPVGIYEQEEQRMYLKQLSDPKGTIRNSLRCGYKKLVPPDESKPKKGHGKGKHKSRLDQFTEIVEQDVGDSS